MKIKATTLILLGVLAYSIAQGKDNQLDTITVESESLEQKVFKAAKNSAIIDEQDIQLTQPVSILQSLESKAGVNLENSNRPMTGNITIRGLTNERINLEVDNIQVQQFADGLSSLSNISSITTDPSFIKSVTIDRGGEGVSFGSGAIGGAVKLETKNARDYLTKEQTIGTTISGSAHSANHGGRFSITSYGAWDNFDILGHISKAKFGDIATDSKEQDSKNRTDNTDSKLKANWQAGEFKIGSITSYSDTELSELPFRNQSRWTDQPLTQKEQAKRFQQGFNILFDHSHWINIESNINYQTFKQTEQQRGQIILVRPTQTSIYDFNIDDTFKENQLDIDIANTLSHSLAGNKASLLSKLEYSRIDFKQNSYDYDEAATGLYYGKNRGNNYALSLTEDIDFGKNVRANFGIRYDKYNRSSSSYPQFGKNRDGALSVNAGISIYPTQSMMLYGRYNEGFRAPNLRELYKKDKWSCHWPRKICFSNPQPNLKPENSKNIEVGFGFNFDNTPFADKFRLKASIYHNTIDNYIATAPSMYKLVNGQRVPASPKEATHRDYSTKNIGEMKSRGFELEAFYQKEKFDINLAYSLIRMDSKDNPNFYLGTIESDKQPYVDAPQDSLQLTLGYSASDELRFSMAAKHKFSQKRLPEIYLERGYGAKKYTTLHFNAQYKPKFLGNTTINFTIDNLTDRKHYVYPDGDGKLQPGRSFKIGLESHF